MTHNAASGTEQSTGALILFCALGAAMLAFVAAGPWIIRTHGYGVFIPAVAASGFLTIAATSIAPRVDGRVVLLIVLAAGLAMRLLLVGEDTFLSTDIYRYIWDGRVQAAGINPYIHVPADPALAALRDAAIYPRINRADYAVTAYPPVAQAIFLAVTRIAETATAMRVAMVGFEVVIVVLVIDLLRRLELPKTAVVAYAWHPLAIWEISNNGHVEAAMVALIMMGVWLLVRMRRVIGAILVALAVLVKPYAVFALPPFWERWDWRVPVALIATIAICYLPYLGAGKGVLGFLSSGYLSEEGLTTGQGIWLPTLVQALIGKATWFTVFYFLAAAAIMIWLGWRNTFSPERRPREIIASVVLLLTAGLVLISPNYAWYFLALVPFIPLGAGASAWALTLGAFLLYRPIFLPHNDLIWKTFATLPFLIVLVIVAFRHAAARKARLR